MNCSEDWSKVELAYERKISDKKKFKKSRKGMKPRDIIKDYGEEMLGLMLIMLRIVLVSINDLRWFFAPFCFILLASHIQVYKHMFCFSNALLFVSYFCLILPASLNDLLFCYLRPFDLFVA